MGKKRKLHKLENLEVFSIHLVDDPAVEEAKFLVKKSKGGKNMDKRELVDEMNEEEQISERIQEVEKSADEALKLVGKFLDDIKELADDLPDKIKDAVGKLADAFKASYGYPVPKSKDPELAKLYEELQKHKEETNILKAELWAKERIAEGKPPAVVNKLVELLKSTPAMKDTAEEILKAIPSVDLSQKASEKITKDKLEEMKARVNAVADAVWGGEK